MIQIPAILREITSFGGSFIRKRTPSYCRATLFPPPRDAMSSWHVNELLVIDCNTIKLCTTSEKQFNNSNKIYTFISTTYNFSIKTILMSIFLSHLWILLSFIKSWVNMKNFKLLYVDPSSVNNRKFQLNLVTHTKNVT